MQIYSTVALWFILRDIYGSIDDAMELTGLSQNEMWRGPQDYDDWRSIPDKNL